MAETPTITNVEEPANGDSDATEDRTTDKHSYLLHTNREEECMDVVDYDFGCSLVCGRAEEETILLSEYMIEHSELMTPLLRQRKEVVDYCYLTDHNYNNDERLATFGLLHFLSKDDAKSMMADELITTSVIECWSIMLNELIVKRVLTDEPYRLYLGINHMEQIISLLTTEDDKRAGYMEEIFNAWRGWCKCCKSPLNLDSDMVFIPMIFNKHFFCACINFIDKKIDYLDNREYGGVFTENEYVDMAMITAYMFGAFLDENGVQKGEMVKSFSMRNVQFKWKCTELHDNVDCGVFMMFHMLFYVGKLFDCDLGNATTRIVYRAEIFAILVMSDLNSIRDKLMEKVEEIKTERKALLTVLVEQRRKKAEEEAKRLEQERLWSTPKAKNQNSCDDYLKTPMSVLGSRIKGASDGIGCTLYCGEPEPNSILVSRFMRNNKSRFSLILITRKEVADYCFLDDYIFDQRESVVVYNA